MEKYRFLLSGSGGQGVITMAIILAEAAALYEGLIAVQSQSYGPEARGGATRSDVIISSQEIYFPKVEQADIFVALTNEASSKYISLIKPGGLYISDSDLVQAPRNVDAQRIQLPMYAAVKETFKGKTQAFNICVLGALAEITKTVQLSSLEKVLKGRFAKAHHESNSKALYLGAELARSYVESQSV